MKKMIRTFIVIIFVILSFLFISSKRTTMRSEFHSSQLSKRVTIENEDTERIDYVDQNGKITIAADLGYATIVSIKTNKTKLDKYYDDKGEPISKYQGYYAILGEFDDAGNNIRATYLNLDDKPTMLLSGYAIEEREYNNTGKIIGVRYYDINHTPVCTKAFGYGKKYIYDEDGNINQIIYIDDLGNPMMTSQGFAILVCNYYNTNGPENGKIENEFYLDEIGKPVALSLGQYGVHKEFNEIGQERLITYLDEKGDPIVTNKGYTTVVRTFRADNNVATERYYDLEGEPFSLSEGYYGVNRENSNVVYLNQNGQEAVNLKNYLYKHSWAIIACAFVVIMLSAVLNKWCNMILLFITICTIVYLTLLYREHGKGLQSIEFFRLYRLILSDSESRADIIKNIWLFIPLGAILYRLYPRRLVLLVPVFLSITIEAVQYFTTIGFCDIDDVISNSLGGWIGFSLGVWLRNIKQIIRIAYNKLTYRCLRKK